MSDDCLFCRILAGEIPSTEVLSTDDTYAFRDINPQAPTHVLVIPRRHVDNAHAVTADDADLVVQLLITAQEVAKAEGIDQSGYRLVFNVGDDALNSVPHLHLHVLGGRRLGASPG
jgi:histidine triad (HIT) family protein